MPNFAKSLLWWICTECLQMQMHQCTAREGCLLFQPIVMIHSLLVIVANWSAILSMFSYSGHLPN